MNSYKCLNQQVFEAGQYKLMPIRSKDRYLIMEWRNEQIDILRQKSLLTEKQQDVYFKKVIRKLFSQDHPDQILWSFFENESFIGYGGLVHIDWESKNAEISFLLATKRNQEISVFSNDIKAYIKMIKKIAFKELGFQKIYTYSYNIRPYLYPLLLTCNFKEEARLHKHIFINDSFQDVLIHSCFNDVSI